MNDLVIEHDGPVERDANLDPRNVLALQLGAHEHIDAVAERRRQRRGAVLRQGRRRAPGAA